MRKIISVLSLALLVSGFLIFSSFQPKDRKAAIEKLMDAELEKKLEKYKRLLNERCRKRLLEEAGLRADSIIIARAKALKVIQDTTVRPLAPDRPGRPELLEPIDSTLPEPLLIDTLLNENDGNQR